MKRQPSQGGFLLVEAMIAILIFALGILGLVAMGGAALGAQSDARIRTQAASLASEISSQIALNVNRMPAPDIGIPLSLPAFQNQPAEGPDCIFTGAVSADPVVAAWVAKVTGGGLDGLPGATAANQQILVDVAAQNRVTITLCWRTPSDTVFRRHTFVTHIR